MWLFSEKKKMQLPCNLTEYRITVSCNSYPRKVLKTGKEKEVSSLATFFKCIAKLTTQVKSQQLASLLTYTVFIALYVQ